MNKKLIIITIILVLTSVFSGAVVYYVAKGQALKIAEIFQQGPYGGASPSAPATQPSPSGSPCSGKCDGTAVVVFEGGGNVTGHCSKDAVCCGAKQEGSCEPPPGQSSCAITGLDCACINI